MHPSHKVPWCLPNPPEPPGETFPQLVSFFRILGVARKNAAFECLGAIWCDMEPMVPDECMVLEKYPTGSVVYVLVPAPQFLGLACIIDIRGSGIGREVKVRFFKSRSYCGFDDAWILERSRRLELFSRYHQDDEVSAFAGGLQPNCSCKGSRRGCNGDGGALASAGQLDYHR